MDNLVIGVKLDLEDSEENGEELEAKDSLDPRVILASLDLRDRLDHQVKMVQRVNVV